MPPSSSIDCSVGLSEEAQTRTASTDDDYDGGDELQLLLPRKGEGETTCTTSSIMLSVQHARRLLYVSHACAQFADGTWQFAVVLFLAAICHYQSIFLVSTYYLCTYTAVALCGAPLGRLVDQVERWTAAQLCIAVQNGSVLFATVCCFWILTQTVQSDVYYNGDDTETDTARGHDSSIPTSVGSILLLVGIHVFGSLALVLDQAFTVAIERDWIVVMASTVLGETQTHNDATTSSIAAFAASEAWLSETNVALRQIDLTCKVLAPAVAGWIVERAGAGDRTSMDSSSDSTGSDVDNTAHHKMFCDLRGAAILVGVLNVTALLVEYTCTAKVYRLIPALADKRTQRMSVSLGEVNQDNLQAENGRNNNNKSIEEESLGDDAASLDPWDGLRVYLQQSVVCGGLSLAFIYLNALSFGGIMTGYLLWKDMSVKQVGLWRSISSVTGLLGTFAYKVSMRYTTVVNTGELSVLYLFVCLSVALLSFFVADPQVSTLLLVVSCAASRTGLWVFDITVTLLYQEFVPDGIRGVVGGTQQALNSFFVVLTSGLGLFFREPEQFYVFAATSYLGICIATIVYTFGIFLRGRRYKMALDD